MNTGYVTLPTMVYLAQLLWQLLLGFVIALILVRIMLMKDQRHNQHQMRIQAAFKRAQEEMSALQQQLEQVQCLGCWQQHHPHTPYPTHWTITFCQRCKSFSQEEHYGTQPSLQIQKAERTQGLTCTC